MKIQVGVFPNGNRKPNAYTLWFNPSWEGCCIHTVEAKNGTEAKKIAIREHESGGCKNENATTKSLNRDLHNLNTGTID